MDPFSWAVIIAIFLGGAGFGVGASSLIGGGDDSASEKEAEAVAQLSDMDILKIPCSDKYVEDNGSGQCREMFCWAQTNSKIGEASGISCDAISNINNTITILDICDRYKQSTDKVSCMTLFRERK